MMYVMHSQTGSSRSRWAAWIELVMRVGKRLGALGGPH